MQSIVDNTNDVPMMVLVSRLPSISDYEQEAPQYDCITTLRLLLNKQNNPAVWDHLLLHKWADSLEPCSILTHELCIFRNHFEDRQAAHEEEVEREQKVIVGFLLDWAGLRGAGFTEDEVNLATSLLATHSVR